MNWFFAEYLAYIKNNPQKYWFKRKMYGWGWTPATKEGWLTLFGFIALIVGNSLRLEAQGKISDTMLEPFFIETALLVIILIIICFLKGEPPKWQWGIKDPTSTEKDTIE